MPRTPVSKVALDGASKKLEHGESIEGKICPWFMPWIKSFSYLGGAIEYCVAFLLSKAITLVAEKDNKPTPTKWVL